METCLVNHQGTSLVKSRSSCGSWGRLYALGICQVSETQEENVCGGGVLLFNHLLEWQGVTAASKLAMLKTETSLAPQLGEM